MFDFRKMDIIQLSNLWNRIVSVGSVIIGSVGRWIGGRWVGWLVNKWSVVGWLMVGGFNKTQFSA